MKKGHEYFAMLSEKEQQDFKENLGKRFDGYMERRRESLWHFIAGAFAWYSSPQGEDYWIEIANRKIK